MAEFLTLIAFVGLIVGLLSYITFRFSRRKLYKLAALIPEAIPQLPLIGNAHQFAGNTEDISNTLVKVVSFCNKNDGVGKVWLGPNLYVALTNPYDCEIVLNAALEKIPEYRFMSSWIGNGLISGSVPIWKVHRKLISPTFHPKIIDKFVSIFAEHSEILTNKIAKEAGKGPFDFFKYINMCTLDTICEAAMGIKVHAQDNKNSSYIQAGLRQMVLIQKRMFQIWLQSDLIFKLTPYAKQEANDINILHSFTDNVIKEFKNKNEKEKQFNEHNEKSRFKPFLELLMECTEHGKTFTNVELREEVDTITIAGNDTSAHVVSYVLTLLSCLPDIQEKVVDELREIFGNSKRSSDKDDLLKMKYLERVINETMRLYPIAPIVARELSQDIKIRNYTLPAGTGAIILFRGLHRDKNVWGDNVDDFDPDRFLPENCVDRHPYSYIPFSAGPRDCIGKRYAMFTIKSLVSTIIRSYRVHSNVDYRNIPVKSEILLKPIHGHVFSIENRTNL